MIPNEPFSKFFFSLSLLVESSCLGYNFSQAFFFSIHFLKTVFLTHNFCWTDDSNYIHFLNKQKWSSRWIWRCLLDFWFSHVFSTRENPRLFFHKMVNLILGNLVSDQKCSQNTTLINLIFMVHKYLNIFEGETLSQQTFYLIISPSRASVNQDKA